MGEARNPTLSILLPSSPASAVEEEGEEQQFYAQLQDEIRETTEELIVVTPDTPDTPEIVDRGRSWERASEIISRIRPIPKAVWVMLRSVFSEAGVIRDSHPGVFFALDRLLRYAVRQKPFDAAKDKTDLRQIVSALGVDVCAALAFIHAFSRKISTSLPESLWRPIIQQSFRRTLIGYYLGANSGNFGRGRCMVCGFISHAVLGIGCIGRTEPQIKEAQAALRMEGKLRELIKQFVGCDALQIVSIALAAGAFGKEAALGIGSLTQNKEELTPGTEEYRWCCALTVPEKISLGGMDKVTPAEWEALGMKEEETRDLLEEKLKNLDRKGFDLMWLTWPQTFMAI